MPTETLQPVSVILLLGLLGVGKTTTIQHLLTQRPKHERWAVLVNEFGALGVDQVLLGEPDVFVSHVAGGCLCCAAGPVTRVKLNQLLRQARPQRLLIEPSGVAHPHEILNLLSAPEYRGLLRLESIITLVDPRHLTEPRYQNFSALQEQLQVAHWIAMNKSDLCSAEQIFQAQLWMSTQTTVKSVSVRLGQIPDHWWLRPLSEDESTGTLPSFTLDWSSPLAKLGPDECQQRCHEAHGFHTLSWRMHALHRWDSACLKHILFQQNTLRIKGVVPTKEGWCWFNLAAGDLSMGPSPPQDYAVIEFVESHSIDAEQTWALFRTAVLQPQNVNICTY